MIICHEHQKQAETFYELYIDKVIRRVHQFIDQTFYRYLGNIWNQSLDFIVKFIPNHSVCRTLKKKVNFVLE